MTYEEAQLTIDDKTKTDSLAESLRNLNSLAKILKKKRLENGSETQNISLASLILFFSYVQSACSCFTRSQNPDGL